MSVGAIVAVVTLVVVAVVYMAYTMGEISEMRKALVRIERRQKLSDMPKVKRPDIEVLPYE